MICIFSLIVSALASYLPAMSISKMKTFQALKHYNSENKALNAPDCNEFENLCFQTVPHALLEIAVDIERSHDCSDCTSEEDNLKRMDLWLQYINIFDDKPV